MFLEKLGGPPNLIGMPLVHVPGVTGAGIGLVVDGGATRPVSAGGGGTVPRPAELLTTFTEFGLDAGTVAGF